MRLTGHIAGIEDKGEIKKIIRTLSFGERRIANAFPKFITEITAKWIESKRKAIKTPL